MFEGIPILENDISKTVDLDKEVKASGHLNQEELATLDEVTQTLLDQVDNGDQPESSDDEDQEMSEENKQEEGLEEPAEVDSANEE